MEKFMLLFRGSDVYQPDQSPEDLQALKEKMMNWVMDLVNQEIHVSSEPLEQTGKQVNGNKKIVIDQPFGEGKAVIGGCTIIQVKNIDEAIAIAQSCPILETNANIEVRAIQSFN
ncbi:YciI family protein [Mucilaginibacter sp. HD30]